MYYFLNQHNILLSVLWYTYNANLTMDFSNILLILVNVFVYI